MNWIPSWLVPSLPGTYILDCQLVCAMVCMEAVYMHVFV